MAKVKLSNDWNRLIAHLEELPEQTMNRVSEAIEEGINDGVDNIRRTIETTPSGIKEGKPDRIWTGNMHDKVTSDLTTRKGEVTGRYGWLNLSSEEADYIHKQEYGGGHVSFGMNALGQSWLEQVEALKRRLSE